MFIRGRVAGLRLSIFFVPVGFLTSCVFVDHDDPALIRNGCDMDITVELLTGVYERPSDLEGLRQLGVEFPGLYHGPVDIPLGEVVEVSGFINFDRRDDQSWTVAVADRLELLHLSHEEIEAIRLDSGAGFEWTLSGDDCA